MVLLQDAAEDLFVLSVFFILGGVNDFGVQFDLCLYLMSYLKISMLECPNNNLLNEYHWTHVTCQNFLGQKISLWAEIKKLHEEWSNDFDFNENGQTFDKGVS